MRRRLLLLCLPLVLLLTSGYFLGTYTETNDDLAIVALLRGITAAAPVTDLHLYFHGYAALWARLYVVWPAVPWYALTLYALLYVATVLAFALLDRAVRPRVGARASVVCLVLFFALAWLEHGFWFNYARVPVLLAGTGVLFAAQRPDRRWALGLGLLAFALAWLIRPSAAVLGALAATPGAWWLAGRRAGRVLGGVAVWAAAGALVLHLTWSPQARAFRRLDVLKSNLNDFQLAAPPTPLLSSSDSLALAATRHWQLADSTLVNEAALSRAAPLPSPGYFVRYLAPPKLAHLLRQLPRDYFPLILLLLATLGLIGWQQGTSAHWFWWGQVGYLGLVLGLGVGLKLPPRLALPVLDCWLLSNLVYLLQTAPQPRLALRVLLLVAGLAAGPYAYKIWHRRQVLSHEQRRHQAQLHYLATQTRAARVLVSDGVEEFYKSQSPFHEAVLPRRPLLSVAGWPTLHPSQPALRQTLTGTRDFTQALRSLGARADVAWQLTPAGAALLNRQLARRQQPGQLRVWLEPVGSRLDSSENAMHAYQMRTKFLQ